MWYTLHNEARKGSESVMIRTVGIGIQDFTKLREGNYFYVDKTAFIKEWWESGDDVTLITRPRRFGKTLNMSMLEHFFSVDYSGRGDLFEGLSIWKEEKYRQLQGTYPVISLSFAGVKETTYATTREKICQILTELFNKYFYLRDSEFLSDVDRMFFDRMLSSEIGDTDATLALHRLSKYLYQYYGKRVIILLDEYDTPMQEAYVHGFWEELVGFTRSLFNSTFKTNSYMQRSIMTGITRVSKESMFSDLNNLEVVTTTSDKYATAFGFTEEEVFLALDEFELGVEKEKVKQWYDGFIFGGHKDIYNPWSILNFLAKRKYATYWSNTSSNGLAGKLIREGNVEVKKSFEDLLEGKTIRCTIDEQIAYNQLDNNPNAIWSLLLASGYLKVLDYEDISEVCGEPNYDLTLTNFEVLRMFNSMVRSWFTEMSTEYNGFLEAMLSGDVDTMNDYMGELALEMFSSFDTGRRVSKRAQPERFYHGFVLGLLVDLQQDYVITSNRESGFGRYDVMLEPKDPTKGVGIIIEFKVLNQRRENSLEETVSAALQQIEEKKYETTLLTKGVPADRIYKYGFAFEGKEVLIEMGE